MTGTDEHGVNIQRAAARANRTPQEQADYVVAYYKRIFHAFGLDTESGGFDIFMRTTERFHYEGVSAFWRAAARAETPKNRDAIYKGFYEGWFCAACAAYKTEDEYVKSADESALPLCLIHETPLDRVSEESYFFRLSDYDEALLELYQSQPDFIRPDSRRNEVISFVRGGLQDLSISRPKSSVEWGIPVPDDPTHSIYVWFDALSNYITAIGYGTEERERLFGFEKYWPATHLVGKDILRFHAVYWPAFLMAAAPQPRGIVAHAMWVDPQGRKMSKTLGNIISLDVLERYFKIDVIRYFCLSEMALGQDGKFGYEKLIERANADLAGGLGNLSSRTLTMIHRYCDGRVPPSEIADEKRLAAKRLAIDADAGGLASTVEHARDQLVRRFAEYAFSRGLEAVWEVVARTDKLISDAKPWELAKNTENRQILHAVLYRAAEVLRWLAVLLHPAMPDATRAIWKQLGLQESELETTDPTKLTWGELRAGTPIGEVEPVFPRIEKAKIMSAINDQNEIDSPVSRATEADAVMTPAAVTGTQPTTAPSPVIGATEADAALDAPSDERGYIEIDDFIKVELRVAEILTAERVPKADKLLRFTVDIGESQPRQILAGIAQYYEPEKLIGRKVIVVANLKPATSRLRVTGHDPRGFHRRRKSTRPRHLH
ncbi:MAG: methionine--tRNA ligase [Pyrinomonadaceae bacterium]